MLTIDASRLLGLHPLCAVRLGLFVERHRAKGCEVDLIEPTDHIAREVSRAFGIGVPPMRPTEGAVEVGKNGEVILGLTQLSELTEVDTVANALLEPLVEHFDEVAVVRDAVLMAFSELCQNAVEHGTSDAGCLVAMSRGESEGMSRIMLGIGDLGVGIPQHIRRGYPHFLVDEHAIGHALQEGISGTARGDRGYGFHWVLEETLVSAATAAEMFVRAGSGSFRREIVDGRLKDHGWRSKLTRGTWLAHEWTTVLRRG